MDCGWREPLARAGAVESRAGALPGRGPRGARPTGPVRGAPWGVRQSSLPAHRWSQPGGPPTRPAVHTARPRLPLTLKTEKHRKSFASPVAAATVSRVPRPLHGSPAAARGVSVRGAQSSRAPGGSLAGFLEALTHRVCLLESLEALSPACAFSDEHGLLPQSGKTTSIFLSSNRGTSVTHRKPQASRPPDSKRMSCLGKCHQNKGTVRPSGSPCAVAPRPCGPACRLW